MARESEQDENLAPQFIAAVWSLAGASGCCISVRIFARCRKGTPLWWDEVLIITSWLCLIAASSSITYATTRGLGRHTQYLNAEEFEANVFHGTVIVPPLTIGASVFSKISFALSLLRITSSGCTEVTRKIIWGVIISLSIMLLVATVMLLVTCSPIEKIWNIGMKGKCLSNNVRIIGALLVAAYSGVTDFTLAILPWKIIICLPIVKRQKISLMVVMSLGFFAGVASFVKCAQIKLMIDADFTYTAWLLCFWSFFEPTLTIIAASMPVLRKFFQEVILLDRDGAKAQSPKGAYRVDDAERGGTGPQITVDSVSIQNGSVDTRMEAPESTDPDSKLGLDEVEKCTTS